MLDLKKENFELKQKIKELESKIQNLTDSRGEKQKLGMIKKASQGKHMSRTPFGYNWDLKQKTLVPAQNFREVEEIYEEFLQEGVKLTALAKKRNFSVNGLKKVLKNFVYVGKIKFDGQIHDGKHKAIISSTLFNKVQDKLERGKKK
ncbi:MAG: recombinase family protein [Nanoarchaeota archaeon]